jgi:hypothetical protein
VVEGFESVFWISFFFFLFFFCFFFFLYEMCNVPIESPGIRTPAGRTRPPSGIGEDERSKDAGLPNPNLEGAWGAIP